MHEWCVLFKYEICLWLSNVKRVLLFRYAPSGFRGLRTLYVKFCLKHLLSIVSNSLCVLYTFADEKRNNYDFINTVLRTIYIYIYIYTYASLNDMMYSVKLSSSLFSRSLCIRLLSVEIVESGGWSTPLIRVLLEIIIVFLNTCGETTHYINKFLCTVLGAWSRPWKRKNE